MIYRTFGRTGLQMPVFSCGGMRYQQSWSDMPLAEGERENQRNLEATIRRAVELGCKLSINSDAHELGGMEMMEYGIATARRAWVTAENVINTLPLRELLAGLKQG